jgi:transposase-like protein
MKNTANRFPDELKKKAVEEFLTTSQTQREIMLKYNIRGMGSLSRWRRTFGISEPNQQEIDIQLIMNKEANKTKRELELEAKIQELEKDLDTERFRTKALNKMIDIIERDLKIPVRKKSGTKQ